MIDNPLLLAMLPVIVGGIFTLLGIWLTDELSHRRRNSNHRSYEILTPPLSSKRTQQQKLDAKFDPNSRILRDSGLILLIHNLTVMLVASGFGVHSIRSADFFAVSVLIGVPILLVALTTVAALANGDRWRHLRAVTLLFWIVNALIYWLLGVVGIGAAFAALIAILIVMGVAGGLSYLFKNP